MQQRIRVGMFGFGKAGKEVAGQFLNDPGIDLCWIVRGHGMALDNVNAADVTILGS